MRIGIDARFLTHPQPGGFKTYSENLVLALAGLDTEHEFVLYLDRQPTVLPAVLRRANIHVRVVRGTLPLVGMFWREQVTLARQAIRDKLDLLHAPSLTAPLRLACPLVVTIHDIIWRFPEHFASDGTLSLKRRLMREYYRLIPALATRHATAVITVSQAAKESIVQALNIPPERITVTHEAASPHFRPLDKAACYKLVKRRFGLEEDYLLAIGSADPRKNLVTLLEAYAQLSATIRERYRLAIVWTHALLADDLTARAEALGIAQRVSYLRQVSDEELVALYNRATLFVFPSLYEGFGLPPLEAMACGTAVVAADNSSIPEITGDAALLVPARDPQAMAQAVACILGDEALRHTMVQHGQMRAKSFSWQRCAQETAEVYHQAVCSPPLLSHHASRTNIMRLSKQ